jgi:hypothetical protein
MCIVTNLDIVKIKKNDFDVFKNNTQICFYLFSAVVTVPKFTDFYFSVGRGPPKDFEIKFVLNNGRNKFSFSCPCGLRYFSTIES